MIFNCNRSSGNKVKPHKKCKFVREHIFGKKWNIEINSIEDLLQVMRDTECELAIYDEEELGGLTIEIVDDYR